MFFIFIQYILQSEMRKIILMKLLSRNHSLKQVIHS